MGLILGSIKDTYVNESTIKISNQPPENNGLWFNPEDKSLYIKFNGEIINLSNSSNTGKFVFIGNTKPSPIDYKFWFNPDTNTLYLSDNNDWIRVNFNIVFSNTKPENLNYLLWYDTSNNKLNVFDGTDYIPVYDDSKILALIDKLDDIYIGDTQPNDPKYKFWINTSNSKVYFRLNNSWKLVNEDDFIIYSSLEPDTTNLSDEIKFWFDTDKKILYIRSNQNTWLPVYVEDPDNAKLVISDTQPTSDKYDFWYDTSTNNLMINVNGIWIKVHKDNSIVSISSTKPTDPDVIFWYNTTDSKLYLNVNGTFVDISSGSNSNDIYVGDIQPEPSLYKVWINPNENLIYVSNGTSWTALNTTGNDTYMIKLNSYDKYPDYIANKLDSDILVIDNNKITSEFIRDFIVPGKVRMTITIGSKDVNAGEFFVVSLQDYDYLTNAKGFKIYDDNNNEISYVFVNRDNETRGYRHSNTKTDYIAIKSTNNYNSGTNISFIIEFLDYEYIPSPDLFYEIYKPLFTNLNEYKTNNVSISNNVLILNSRSYLISNKTFVNNSIVVETAFEIASGNPAGSVCRLADNDKHGLVKDGGAGIADILLWYGNYYYEWNSGENIANSIDRTIRIHRNKMLINRDRNNIYYYMDGKKYVHSGGLIKSYKQYFYIENGTIKVYSTYVYPYVYKLGTIKEITGSDSQKTIHRKVKLDLVQYDYTKFSIVARDLNTNEFIDFGIKDDKLTYIKRPVILYPLDKSLVNDSQIIIRASEYQTISNFNSDHKSSDWQIATDESFTNIVEESLDDSDNLTTYKISNSLDTGISYYVRVRYRSQNDFVSDWSIPTEFIINDKPIIESIEWNSEKLYANIEYTLTIHAIDKTNTNLIYEVINISDGDISITQDEINSNVFHVKFPITPNDSDRYLLRIKVSDGQGGVSIEDIEVEVYSALFRRLDIFEDSSCISLYKFEGTSIDVGGIAQLEWYGNEKYIDNGIYGLSANLDTTNALKITNFRDLVDENNGYSISIWIKFNEDDNGGTVLSTGLYNWLLLLHPDKFFKIMLGKDKWYLTNTGFKIINYNDFNHIVINFINNTSKRFLELYINNYLVGRYTFDKIAPISYLSIGGRFDCCIQESLLGCNVDQLRIFNRMLSIDEIDFIYKNRL